MFGYKHKKQVDIERQQVKRSVGSNFRATCYTGDSFLTYLAQRVEGGLYEYHEDSDIWTFPCGSLKGYMLKDVTSNDIVVDIQGPNGSSFWGLLFKKERFGYNIIGLNKDSSPNKDMDSMYYDAFMLKTMTVLPSVVKSRNLFYDANLKYWLKGSKAMDLLGSRCNLHFGDARG